MMKLGKSIAVGLASTMVLVGCSEEGAPSVPTQSGADTAKRPDNAQAPEKRSKASAPASAEQ